MPKGKSNHDADAISQAYGFARRQASDTVVVAVASWKLHALVLEGHDEVGRRQKVEIRGRHAYDPHRHSVDDRGASNDPGIGSES